MTLLADFTDAVARYEAVIGPETHVGLGDDVEDVLRLRDGVRGAADPPGLPHVPGPCPGPCP